MRVSFNWLKDYVDIPLSPEELGRVLTMAGLEVEAVEAVGASLDDVLVARIVDVAPHPRADRLSICQVDTGKERVQVVCGAPNLSAGMLVPHAPPGAGLPNGLKVESAKIRGELSSGMLLAEDEMDLTADHSGIMVLPAHLLPGTPIARALPLTDWVFDVSLTPNRADCASVIGIAREIAANLGNRVKGPEVKVEETGPAIEKLTSVAIEDPEGCPRYAAGVLLGLTIGPSPFWMRYRLHLAGVRSINAVVDVTNYVMLEMGQPLHAFDYNRLRENRIVVRRASDGEKFTTLDGQTHALQPETLMICDAERSVALAGVMGGLNSEIFSETKDVLLESAYFDPTSIRRTARRLGLATEASYRFERGIDIEGVTRALNRALSMMSELAGGRVAKGIVDNYPRPYKKTSVDLRVGKTNQFLGTSFKAGEMSGYLRSLEMEVEEVGEDLLRVSPPSFRVDVSREADLMEEVARLGGYEEIPVTSPRIRPSEVGEHPELLLRQQSKSIMVGLGFNEIITYSFISPDSADMLGADEDSPLRAFVKLLNPLSTDQSVMRTSLIPGLLSTVAANRAHGERELKFFEWGKTFLAGREDQLPVEREWLGAVMTGPFREKTWYGDERTVDFYDLKGAVEAFLKAIGVERFSFKRMEKGVRIPGYHPERTALIYSGESLLGQVGQVADETMEAFDLKREKAFLFELDVAVVLGRVGEKKFRPFARFPAVYRDISLIVPRDLESSRVIDIIEREGGELVEAVNVFDLYQGKRMDPLEKALAFRICYRSREGTLEGGYVNRLHESIIHQIGQETGGRLREG